MPFLGICLGMQLATIEYLSNKLQIAGVNSTEIDINCKVPIVALVEQWQDASGVLKKLIKTKKGGTMRVGEQICNLASASKLRQIYGTNQIAERHRHRYEVSNVHINKFLDDQFLVSGLSEDAALVETIEIKNHRWFIGCQFHPEFKSKPLKPHPLFNSYLDAALKYSKANSNSNAKN